MMICLSSRSMMLPGAEDASRLVKAIVCGLQRCCKSDGLKDELRD